jgi:hypothetical protein
VMYGLFHRLGSNYNLDCMPEDPSLKPGSKCKEIGLLEGMMHVLQVQN